MGALAGIRVVDLSNRLSGAWAARLFAGFGADVVLGEPPDGHPLRDEPPFLGNEPGAERSLLHAYANAGKRSVVVQDGGDLAALCAGADVVVTTSVALPECLADYPGVHLSITAHGLEGPLAQTPGNHLTACARVGWATINGRVGEPPLQLPGRQTGYIAGVAGFVSATAALVRGGAERVDVSEAEALALTCAPWAVMGIFIGGESVAFGPNGPRHKGRPGPLWKAKDGLINYGYGDWQRWTPALQSLGLGDLAVDERYVKAWGRHQQDTRPVRDGLAEASAVRGKWDLFHGLAGHRCISGVVQDARELRDSEQLNARGFIVETAVDGAMARAAGAPTKLSATPWKADPPAPRLGEGGLEASGTHAQSGTAPTPGKQPLDGVRVLCFTQAWAGTFCTEILALLGADVVQIETVRRPDVWRGAGAPVPPAVRNPDIEQSGINTNGMYNTVNLGKRAITLDVTHPRGKEMFWNLIPKFDVLVDNFSPHVMTNWGVTLETLHERRPDMIFASVSGYGRQGPLAEYPANGATTEPMAGLASIHGYEGDEPMNTGGLIPDPISGYYLAAAIVAAIHHRQRTGEGQRIDAAMIEAVAVQVGDAILECDANGNVRGPQGNRHPRFAPHGIYRTANDEWLALATESDAEFAALATAMNRPALAQDARYASAPARKANEAALDQIVAAWLAERDAAATAEALGEAGLHAARVEPFKPIYAGSNPQWEHRGFLAPVPHPESGTHLMPLMPWVFANTPRGDVRHSPLFGQHSREVFAEELGLGDEDYGELEESMITGTRRVG